MEATQTDCSEQTELERRWYYVVEFRKNYRSNSKVHLGVPR